MGIDDSLGIARRARCVTHRRGIIFIQLGQKAIFGSGLEELFVVLIEARLACAGAANKNAFEWRILDELLEYRQKHVIHDQKAVSRMFGDERKLLRGKAQI